MIKPDISIIIPAYNAEQYIGQCLDSILSQDGAPDFEIIVVNDGSTDNTPQIVREYGYTNHNIRMITQKNRGVSVARNNGLACANGRFITFVDADDRVGASYTQMVHYFEEPDSISVRGRSDKAKNNMLVSYIYFMSTGALSKIQPKFDDKYFVQMLKPMSDNKTDIAMGGKITIDHVNNTLSRNIYESDHIYGTTYNDKKIVFTIADIRESANFALFRHNFLIRNNLTFASNMKLDEDMLFMQQAALRARQVATVANCTYLYNRHADTLSTLPTSILGMNPEYELSMIQRHSVLLNELRNDPRHAQLYSYFLQKYAQEQHGLAQYHYDSLPGRCGLCSQEKCKKCPHDEYVGNLLNHNIRKYMAHQK